MRKSVATFIGALALVACSQSGNSQAQAGDGAVCSAYQSQRSHVEVVATGKISRMLGTRDGRNGSHEGFLVKLDSGCDLVVKVETNVSLTGPVPLQTGEAVTIKGEYEYYQMGGVIHWTHRDPRGNHEGGYVQAGGATYQ
ncbi:MAG: DUF3465 domain-containing protein [Candidatus Baltobacteraceae bacterium]